MHKTGYVLYVDGLGKTHDALVLSINPLHPDFVTLAYVHENADERANLVTVFDVPHKDNEVNADLRKVVANGPTAQFGQTVIDGNPNLPHFDVNCWMERDEQHSPLPADHPAFDHPWKQPEFDQSGNRIPVKRTEYEREVAEHLAAKAAADANLPSAADLDADADEKKQKAATEKKVKTWPTAKNGKS